jgi:hypothetical protein
VSAAGLTIGTTARGRRWGGALSIVAIAAVVAGSTLLVRDLANRAFPTVGSRSVPTSAAGGIDLLRAFPPSERNPAEPIAGAVVADSTMHPMQIVIGIEGVEPGRYAFPGVILDHHVGSTRYRTMILQGLIVCADRGVAITGRRRGGTGALIREQERLRSLLGPDDA